MTRPHDTISEKKPPTRGKGLLEPLLARLRVKRANALIPNRLREGRILDIGCGSYPYFLSHSLFREKYGIDQGTADHFPDDVKFFSQDLNRESRLPYEDCFFDAVTLLAVIEHLDPAALVALFREVHRVLKPGGMVVLTTPAVWANLLLKSMARCRLVSREEIDEHVFAYSLPLLGWYFGSAGFPMRATQFGYFECFLNIWATALREPETGDAAAGAGHG